VTENWEGNSAKPTTEITNTYQWWDGPMQATTTFDPNKDAAGPAYVYRGLADQPQLARVEIRDGRTRDAVFANDINGQGLQREETLSGDRPREIWHRFNGKLTGYVGNNGTPESDYSKGGATQSDRHRHPELLPWRGSRQRPRPILGNRHGRAGRVQLEPSGDRGGGRGRDGRFAPPDRSMLFFAGVCTAWRGDYGSKKEPNVGVHQLFSSLTTDANELFGRFTPVAIRTEAEQGAVGPHGSGRSDSTAGAVQRGARDPLRSRKCRICRRLSQIGRLPSRAARNGAARPRSL
jgi:hypothetical protein